MKIQITFLAFALALLYGCSASDESVSLKLTKWQLESLTGTTMPAMDKKPSMEFTADKVGGFGGCNTYGGTYSTSGSTITTSELFSTEMACDNLELEKAFLDAVHRADNYKVKNSKLYLYTGKELKAVLTKVK